MLAAIVQLNPKVGDIDANRQKILAAAAEAARQGARLVVFPEMALLGYPPRDLLLYPSFVDGVEEAGQILAREANFPGVTVIVGTVGRNGGKGRPLTNQAIALRGGEIVARYAKRLLPTYDVFDEARYFEAGDAPLVLTIDNVRVAVTVCEDIWNDEAFWPRPLYRVDPLAAHPPFDVLVNLSASPFSVGKEALREEMLSSLAVKYRARILYANQVGANDELIFDGRSSFFDPRGKLMARAKPFAEDALTVDLEGGGANRVAEDDFTPEAETWGALGLGARDYCRKNGIDSVAIGLSGGIDSALTAAIAASAMGPEKVHGLIMPSPYSSSHSVADALELGKRLRLGSLYEVPIGGIMESFDAALAPLFRNLAPDSAEENVQARARGILLMAVANKFGRALLTTGNKSEISVGYCTIYGDMCGALAVIGDLYKTEVFNLARWVNRAEEIIPQSTLEKPPSAELRPDQKDEDSLPPYAILDAALRELLEKRLSPAEVARDPRFDPEMIRKIARLTRAAEFKRRQAAPVLKITSQAFGVGWRMPIACQSVFNGDFA
ncbi:MAG: NAD+ synthase [Deltaproteobacteria bacterium]|jgi:NAD+ synthetase|nr:NAD+ synthase [Deltaproteobacteria bacterium]